MFSAALVGCRGKSCCKSCGAAFLEAESKFTKWLAASKTGVIKLSGVPGQRPLQVNGDMDLMLISIFVQHDAYHQRGAFCSLYVRANKARLLCHRRRFDADKRNEQSI